jgi:carbonic anhydrase
MLPERLVAGYSAFKAGRFVTEQARWRRLAETGQKPQIMIIACCDSRAAPEVIFDAGPGEVFVVRNVANLVPPYAPDGEYHGTSAALEFAVMALKVTEIVVMGHGRCGGIAAALKQEPDPLSPGDFIGKWISLLDPLVNACQCETHASADAQRLWLERMSVATSLAHLRTFPCVKTLESRGRLRLHGAWFDIREGELWWFDEPADSWSTVAADPQVASEAAE